MLEKYIAQQPITTESLLPTQTVDSIKSDISVLSSKMVQIKN